MASFVGKGSAVVPVWHFSSSLLFLHFLVLFLYCFPLFRFAFRRGVSASLGVTCPLVFRRDVSFVETCPLCFDRTCRVRVSACLFPALPCVCPIENARWGVNRPAVFCRFRFR
jgi:hypothetical protein